MSETAIPAEELKSRISLRVVKRHDLTADISEFTLAGDNKNDLGPIEAGAHITVETPNGAMRRYSLVNPTNNATEYIIAVKHDPASRGGSASMHHNLQRGDYISVEPPQNNFALTSSEDTLLIAGGIGITPVYAMAQQLIREKRAFQLIYCVRSAIQAAYVDELRQLCGEMLLLHEDDGDPQKVFDFWELFETPGKQHVFCCGPDALMEEIRAISGHWPENAIHFEDFKPIDVVRENDTPFTVELNRSGLSIDIPADKTILESIREAAVDVSSSCESGTCGTCKCGLLEGAVDHRDQVLMDDERDRFIMICVSRAAGDRLVLDL